ncbi:hypothetical protein FNU76_00910 [Chitinimonas arctica]|uniref:Uncharacterized protein n=1 Tax=Chitinimonas arctica TaxID=2594795 RepID=A0A516SA51_9NEIS|nr:hypothetical protein [Chitinimonas arctica]QDQ25022.1 hypothetical protein FNU76_00910 [Chitinimonas arctica]
MKIIKLVFRLFVLLLSYKICETMVLACLEHGTLSMTLAVAIPMSLMGVSGRVKWPEAVIVLFLMEVVWNIFVLMMMNVNYFFSHLSSLSEMITHGVTPAMLLVGVTAYFLGKYLRARIDLLISKTKQAQEVRP